MARQPRRPRLGKGLSSLIPESPPSDLPGQYLPHITPDAQPARPPQTAPTQSPKTDPLVMLAIDRIAPNPSQPRRHFDEDRLRKLAESIRLHGLLQPVLVAPADQPLGPHAYVLIAGERRLRAAQIAGAKRIPAILRPASNQDMLELALAENLNRADLNPIERARAYRHLIDRFGLSHQAVAERTGATRPTISNFLRLLDLCDDVQAMVVEGALTFGHARALAALAGSPQAQATLALRAVNQGLSVRRVEADVARLLSPATQAPSNEGQTPQAKPPYIADVERQLTEAVGTKVSVRPLRRSGRGRILIEYYSLDDFDRVLTLLGVRIDS